MTDGADMIADLGQQVLALVAERELRRISLDELGEVIGARAISASQIDALMASLERAGVAIGGDVRPDLAQVLRVVIQTARGLRGSGQRASSVAIAHASGLSLQEVKMALLYSEVLRRPS